jgi:ABC-type multidrug transport system fused ATPase/permease subunit
VNFARLVTAAEKTRGARIQGGPGSDSAPEANPHWPTSGAAAEVRALLWAHRRRLALGLALMVVNRLSGLVLPATTKWLMDDVIGQQRWDLLPRLALVALAATLVDAVTSFSLTQVLGVAAQRVITDMRKEIAAHVMRLPIRAFDSTKVGILVARIMNDAEGVRNLVGTGLVQLAGSSLTAVLALGVLVYLNWRLTAMTVFVLGGYGLGMALAFKRLRPLFRERGRISAEVTGRLAEALSGVRVVKAYAAEGREDRVFAAGVHRLFRNVAKSLTGVSAVTATSTVALGVVAVLMMLVGGAAIRQGAMTVGDLVMYLSFTALLALPILQLASLSTQLSEAFAAIDRIRELRRMTTEDDGDDRRAPMPEVRGEVELEDVTFEYVPGEPVLRQVSLRAPSGSTTALVGSSGSGKSTIVGLIMAFDRPRSGRVLVDGHDLATVRLRDYRRQLGVVLQETFLFDGTVAENIAYGRPHATRREIEEAGKLARCDEFVRSFERGYDTFVGERGVRLSGGQRQRVAIARAILADPRVLILDEATSSLDSESEAHIQAGFRALRRNRTTFVIAHRLSTIRSADQILVIEQGTIVERGTHDVLLAHGGRYRQLYDRQFHLERDRFVNPGEDFTPRPDTLATGLDLTGGDDR